MELNYIAILILSLVSFLGGAFWYGPLFGKLWMKIHWEKPPTEQEQKEMMRGMWKMFLMEYIASVLMIFSLACLIGVLPGYSGMTIGFLAWLGFVVPMTISTIIWGGDKRKYWCQKILVSVSYRLVIFILAGYILSLWR